MKESKKLRIKMIWGFNQGYQGTFYRDITMLAAVAGGGL